MNAKQIIVEIRNYRTDLWLYRTSQNKTYLERAEKSYNEMKDLLGKIMFKPLHRIKK